MSRRERAGRPKGAARPAAAASRPAAKTRPEDPRPWLVLLGLAVVVHLALMAPVLTRPFAGVNEDDDGMFGLGAENLARFGFLPLRFGIAAGYFDSAREIGTQFYAHHPQWLVVPTAILYRVFGVSEAATRAPGMVLSALSVLALFGVVRLATGRVRLAALTSFVYATLPGVVHYSSTLSEKTFGLGFTNLLFLAFFALIRSPTALRRALFLLVLAAGGLVGWFFDFAAVALWLYVLFDRSLPHRRFLLVSLVAVPALTVAANFVHFHLLRGPAFREIFGAYRIHTRPLPVGAFLARYRDFGAVNFTWAGGLLALGGLGVAAAGLARRRGFGLLALLAVQPLLVVVLFPTWSTHGFGPIFWAPFVAFASAGAIEFLARRRGVVPKLAALGLAGLLVGLSPGDLSQFREYTVVTPEDLLMLKQFGATAPRSARIAMGEDYRRFCTLQLAEWYLQRDAHRYRWDRDAPDYIIGFNPQIGPDFAAQFRAMEARGYRPLEGRDYLVILKRG